MSSQAKAAGTAAYKAGEWSKAVAGFTEAIDSPDVDVDEIHKLYSNRCAAYMQLKKYKEAKEDAESCTQTKPTWAKGWSRLGECEDARGCYADAVRAFEKAIELEPSNASYKASKASSESRSKRAAAAAPRTAGGGSGGSSLRMLGLLCVRTLMFTNGALYLLSFTTNQKYLDSKFRACVQFYLFSALVNFGQVHGFPKFTKEFLQAIMKDSAVQRLFGGVLLLTGSNFMALVALLLPEAAAFCSSVIQLLRSFRLNSVALRITASLEGTLLDGHGNPYYKVAQYSAYCEVATGILLVLNMLTPRRNLILMVLYWQFLQLRFVLEKAMGNTSGVLHLSFAAVDRRITTTLSKGPGIIMKGYGMVKSMLARQVALPEPGAKPKCTVS